MTLAPVKDRFDIATGDFMELKNRFGVDDHDLRKLTGEENFVEEVEFSEIVDEVLEDHSEVFTVTHDHYAESHKIQRLDVEVNE